MAVISILSAQSDFTGEMPVTNHTQGLWRFNSAKVSDDNEVNFPDSSDYLRPAVLVGSDYTLSSDAVFGSSLELNANSTTSYLRVTNDGTMFSLLYRRFSFGGCFKFPSISTGSVPLMSAQSTGDTSLFRLELSNGRLVVMLCNDTGATCYIYPETYLFQSDRWYFIGVTVDTEVKGVQVVIGDYADGSFYTSPVRSYNTPMNTASEADLLIGAWDYEHEGNMTCASMLVDDVFIEKAILPAMYGRIPAWWRWQVSTVCTRLWATASRGLCLTILPALVKLRGTLRICRGLQVLEALRLRQVLTY